MGQMGHGTAAGRSRLRTEEQEQDDTVQRGHGQTHKPTLKLSDVMATAERSSRTQTDTGSGSEPVIFLSL